MSISVQGAAQAAKPSLTTPTKSPAADQDGGTAKAAAGFGSAPAAIVSLSAKAVAQAKALAIKTGHDPDGIQDGK